MEEQMRPDPRPYERYRHFKGKEYQVLLLAVNSEDESIQVVYQALYGDYKAYVRPLDSFMSETDHEKYPNAVQKYRFEKIETGKAEEKCSDRVSNVQEESSGAGHSPVEAGDIMPVLDKKEEISIKTGTEEPMPDLDPAVLEYLDADTNEEKLNILTGVHHRITEEMITTMSIATDFEVAEGDLEQQYQELKNCLLMKIKFEKTR